MARIALLMLLAAAPEPGLLDPDEVAVGELVIPSGSGNAAKAHDAFLDAHRSHKKGDRVAAVRGYLEFLGIPGHAELPRRYVTTARARLESIRKTVALGYERAVELYRTDRAKGLVELGALAREYDLLPEGRAARVLVQSDATRAAVRDAKAKIPGSVETLEKAILANPASLYLYEAKSVLLSLGGPDLFDPGERIVGEEGSGDSRPKRKEEEEEESIIEIGD